MYLGENSEPAGHRLTVTPEKGQRTRENTTFCLAGISLAVQREDGIHI